LFLALGQEIEGIARAQGAQIREVIEGVARAAVVGARRLRGLLGRVFLVDLLGRLVEPVGRLRARAEREDRQEAAEAEHLGVHRSSPSADQKRTKSSLANIARRVFFQFSPFPWNSVRYEARMVGGTVARSATMSSLDITKFQARATAHSATSGSSAMAW